MLSKKCSFIHTVFRAVISPLAERANGRCPELRGASLARNTNRLVVLGLAIASICVAQEYRGTLSGLVTDPQSAAVPGVKILATQTETGSKYNTVSSGDGRYTIPLLLPGTYSVEAESVGFKRYVRTGIRVSTNESVRVDIRFDLGANSDSVTVTSEAPMLDTTTGPRSAQSSISGRWRTCLCKAGTHITWHSCRWALFRPVVAELRRGRLTMAHLLTRPMGGAPTRRNELLLDGQPNISEDGTMGWAPPVDALQEVKVENFQSDAAYGHTGGGTVSATTKGGTNQYHGTMYEFNQTLRIACNQLFRKPRRQ